MGTLMEKEHVSFAPAATVNGPPLAVLVGSLGSPQLAAPVMPALVGFEVELLSTTRGCSGVFDALATT